MYQALATAVLLAATVFPLRLEGQMRAIQRPSTPARISAGPPFRSAQPHSIGSGVTSPGGFVRRPGFVGPVGFRRHQRFHIFFGNACFSDPFFCRQFFFRNRFFFAQPVFFPYPIYMSLPYYHFAEEKTATTILVFRDGRRSEIQNNALVGQTLWMLTEQRARKVSIFDLDVEATRKLNADRGVEF